MFAILKDCEIASRSSRGGVSSSSGFFMMSHPEKVKGFKGRNAARQLWREGKVLRQQERIFEGVGFLVRSWHVGCLD